MNLYEKKVTIFEAMDNLREKVGKLPDQVTDLGAIVMAGANLWKEGEICPTGEAVGDEVALKACIVHAICHYAARAYVQNETPIAETISMFEKAMRDDLFMKRTMGVIEGIR